MPSITLDAIIEGIERVPQGGDEGVTLQIPPSTGRFVPSSMAEYVMPDNISFSGPRSLLMELRWCDSILRNFPAPRDRTLAQQEEIMLALIEIAENRENRVDF